MGEKEMSHAIYFVRGAAYISPRCEQCWLHIDKSVVCDVEATRRFLVRHQLKVNRLTGIVTEDKDAQLLFVVSRGGDDTVEQYVLDSQEADIIVLQSSRLDHFTAEFLHSQLLGRAVMIGSSFCVGGCQALVTSAERQGCNMQSAVIGPKTRVKVNDCEAPRHLPFIVGLESQVKLIQYNCCYRDESPDVRSTVKWLLLWGKRGNGISSALHCGKFDVISYSPESLLKLPPRSGRDVIVRLEGATDLFPLEDLVKVKLSKSLVEAQVSAAIAKSIRSQVTVVVVLREPPSEEYRNQFDEVVAFSFPDGPTRCKILGSRWSNLTTSEISDTVAKCSGVTRTQLLSMKLSDLQQKSLVFRGVDWNDIGGLHSVKSTLRYRMIIPRTHPASYQRFGLSPPRGLLLYGPPGCAKTTLVKALCTEEKLNFVYVDSAELMSAYVGESERTLRETFALAAERAPCVIFFDEVDVIGSSREFQSGDNGRLLSTLLMELDGFSVRSDVCFVGATNIPQKLDSALLRPGRFDQLLYIPLPDTAAREELFSINLRMVGDEISKEDIAHFAAISSRFSGADIACVCRSSLAQWVVSPSTGPLKDRILKALFEHKLVPYDTEGISEFHARVTSER